MKIKRFEDIISWQKSKELSVSIYKIFKSDTDFGFRNQIEKSSVSIMNNIAEGFARYNNKEFIRFLDFSQSSSSEVKSMLYVLQDLDYLPHNEIENLHSMVDKTRHKTLALVRYLKSSTLKH